MFLFWCTFVVPSFKNTASIFPEILFIQYLTIFSCKQHDVITDLICIIRKTSISPKRKKIFQKEKHHSSVFWKAFQITTNYFSLHRHFKVTMFKATYRAIQDENNLKQQSCWSSEAKPRTSKVSSYQPILRHLDWLHSWDISLPTPTKTTPTLTLFDNHKHIPTMIK